MQRLKTLFQSPHRLSTAIFVLGGIATYILNYPGSMEDDSFVQLLEGRTGSYSNWHPPIMSWMLGVSDALPGPAAAWFVGFDMLLAFAAFTALLWLPKRVSRSTVWCALLFLALPQFVMLEAVVWKDGLFADAVVAGFVGIGLAAKHWRNAHWRLGWIAGSAVLFALAALTRQNGIVVLPCAAVALAIIGVKLESDWRRGAGHGIALFALTGAIAFCGNFLLQLRSDGYPAQQEQFKVLELYDLTGMVYRDRGMALPILDKEAPQLARIIRSEGVQRWSPLKNDTLEMSPRIVAALDATPATVLARQWHQAIGEHPGGYVAMRSVLFRWVFQPPDVALCHPFHVGDQGPAEEMTELGARPRLDGRDIALWQYGNIFLKTPMFSHAAYAILGLLVFAVLLRRKSPTDIAMMALIAAAMMFTATFFVISIACDYRYLYLVDLSALAGLLYAVADWPEPPPKRKGARRPPLIAIIRRAISRG